MKSGIKKRHELFSSQCHWSKLEEKGLSFNLK